MAGRATNGRRHHHTPCINGYDHVWCDGAQSSWCTRCWVVRPPRGSRSGVRTPDGVRYGQTLARLLRRDHACHYCGWDDWTLREPTADHKIPVSKGGGGTLDNLVLACGLCNQAKADMDYRTFVGLLAAGAWDHCPAHDRTTA